jgi:manganese/iron transport system substrate-binding protein
VNPFSLRSLAVVLGFCFLCGCASERRATATATPLPSGTIPVVVTTTILADFVKAVGGSHVAVRGIVPPGASVESYEPAPQDIAAVHDARLIIENGAGLENWLSPLVDNAKAADVPLIVLSSGLTLENHNPHLWMDPLLVRTYVARIRDGLSSIDPAHRTEYRDNARSYNAKLMALTVSVQQQLSQIPQKRRLMLVYHDAWRYYDRRFDLRTAGVIETAPGREPSAIAIAKLVDLARADGITTVFSEPEESTRLADALASSLPKGKVVPLYVDTLGETPEIGDYLSLIRFDTRAIVAALK